MNTRVVHRIHDLDCCICRCVVNDDQFQVPVRLVENTSHCSRQSVSAIMRWQDYTHQGGLVGHRNAATKSISQSRWRAGSYRRRYHEIVQQNTSVFDDQQRIVNTPRRHANNLCRTNLERPVTFARKAARTFGVRAQTWTARRQFSVIKLANRAKFAGPAEKAQSHPPYCAAGARFLRSHFDDWLKSNPSSQEYICKPADLQRLDNRL